MDIDVVRPTAYSEYFVNATATVPSSSSSTTTSSHNTDQRASSSLAMMNSQVDPHLNQLLTLYNFDHLLAKALGNKDESHRNIGAVPSAEPASATATSSVTHISHPRFDFLNVQTGTLNHVAAGSTSNTATTSAAATTNYKTADCENLLPLLRNNLIACSDKTFVLSSISNSNNNSSIPRGPTTADYNHYLHQHDEAYSTYSPHENMMTRFSGGSLRNDNKIDSYSTAMSMTSPKTCVNSNSSLVSSHRPHYYPNQNHSSTINSDTISNDETDIKLKSHFNKDESYHHASTTCSILSSVSSNNCPGGLVGEKRKYHVETIHDDEDNTKLMLLHLEKNTPTSVPGDHDKQNGEMANNSKNDIEERYQRATITKRFKETTTELGEVDNRIVSPSSNQQQSAINAEEHSHQNYDGHDEEDNNNNGGIWKILDFPLKFSSPSDKEALTPLQCFIRDTCIVLFTACETDIISSSRGKRHPVSIGQVGICCSFCYHHHSTSTTTTRQQRNERIEEYESGSSHNNGGTYYPWKISSLYSASMNLIQRHFFACPNIPSNVREIYCSLKQLDARSGTSKTYWCQAAYRMGLIDTSNGIRLKNSRNQEECDSVIDAAAITSTEIIRDSPLPSSFSIQRPTQQQQQHIRSELEYLCFPDDQTLTTKFSFLLMRQMTSCKFTEGDRLGKRKDLPINFPGLACRHCISDFGSGRFFPSTLKTISDTSKTLNVLHRHLLKCRHCPTEVKDDLNSLRRSHDTERASMMFGCQKAFFFKVWNRIHKNPKHKV